MKVDRCHGQVECQVAARRLWRAAFQDAQDCLPKAVPNALLRIDYDGPPFQPGSFRILNYHINYAIRISKENNLKHLVQYTKEKILEVDNDSLKVKTEVVEGGYLDIMVKSYSYSIHIIEGALPDTSVVHWSFEYKPISPKHHLMMSARLNEVIPLSIKGVETYLLSNDDYKDEGPV
ncbi:hypothetical protein GOP47_0021742 [Adiantum capillus-veneris]|uniref:Bet v I/Major latex protein domain-containing protein n=1 Tax=Adiantum capillus-veneris TaxID=13818 RepID=A0A9D4U8Q0_ADICA|nr:hypothetical protein GOP47_0021742 [Adiantum capillus-veneris]